MYPHRRDERVATWLPMVAMLLAYNGCTTIPMCPWLPLIMYELVRLVCTVFFSHIGDSPLCACVSLASPAWLDGVTLRRLEWFSKVCGNASAVGSAHGDSRLGTCECVHDQKHTRARQPAVMFVVVVMVCSMGVQLKMWPLVRHVRHCRS